MAFAQFSFICYWALVWHRLQGSIERFSVMFLLLALYADGAWQYLETLNRHPSGLPSVIQFIQRHQLPGDVVLTTGAGDLNRLQYYVHREGMTHVSFRCFVSQITYVGHREYLAVLDVAEVLWSTDRWPTGTRPTRYWQIRKGNHQNIVPPDGMNVIQLEYFHEPNTTYTVILFSEIK
jgi:hypothetical protein